MIGDPFEHHLDFMDLDLRVRPAPPSPPVLTGEQVDRFILEQILWERLTPWIDGVDVLGTAGTGLIVYLHVRPIWWCCLGVVHRMVRRRAHQFLRAAWWPGPPDTAQVTVKLVEQGG